jgi:ribosomal 50S subunit-associated protein YjgA (DUF615 family)
MSVEDAEIDRLKGVLETSRAAHKQDVAELQRLLTRAADALERVDKNWPNEDYGADEKLIRKLRKAAK